LFSLLDKFFIIAVLLNYHIAVLLNAIPLVTLLNVLGYLYVIVILSSRKAAR